MDSPKKLIKKYMIRPKKRFGQHFISDRSILNKIIKLSGINDGDFVLEIGAGFGHLTERLARSAFRVYAIEIDPFLFKALSNELMGLKNVELHRIDALDFPSLRTILPPSKNVKVVSNLPYQISKPFISSTLLHAKSFSEMTLMLQEEVAGRVAAPPGNRERGILSVLCQASYTVNKDFLVPRNCFYPVPEVDSAVVRFLPLNGNQIKAIDQSYFIILVKAAFSQRRKTIFNALKSSSHILGVKGDEISEVLTDCDIDPKRRAETFSVQEFTNLSNELLRRRENGRR